MARSLSLNISQKVHNPTRVAHEAGSLSLNSPERTHLDPCQNSTVRDHSIRIPRGGIILRISKRYPPDIPQISSRHSPNIPKLSPRYPQDIPKLSPIHLYSQDLRLTSHDSNYHPLTPHFNREGVKNVYTESVRKGVTPFRLRN